MFSEGQLACQPREQPGDRTELLDPTASPRAYSPARVTIKERLLTVTDIASPAITPQAVNEEIVEAAPQVFKPNRSHVRGQRGPAQDNGEHNHVIFFTHNLVSLFFVALS